MVKNLPANTGDIRDTSFIPWSGRSPGGGHGIPLWHSCQKIPWAEEPGRLQSMKSQSRTQLGTHTQGPWCYCNTPSGCIFAFFSVSMSLTSAYIIKLHDPGQYFSNFLVHPHTFFKVLSLNTCFLVTTETNDQKFSALKTTQMPFFSSKRPEVTSKNRSLFTWLRKPHKIV